MNTELPLFDNPRFDGPDYNSELDQKRLRGQIQKIHNLMIDGIWRTLNEIEKITGFPQASISAQLRHLRKKRFGCYNVNKQRRGEGKKGLFEYKLESRVKPYRK